MARSAAGSSIRRPPATLTYTSWLVQVQPGVAGQHRDEHEHPIRVDPGGRATRGAVAGRGAQRLDLDRQRARPLQRDRDGRACRRRLVRLEEEAAGIGDLRHAVAAHLEHADLVGRAEAVLRRAQQAGRAEPLPFQVDHRVDEVLERSRAGHRALLGDMADERDAGAAALGGLGKARGDLAHLADAPRRAGQVTAGEGLDAVDHRESRDGSPRSRRGPSRGPSSPPAAGRPPRRRPARRDHEPGRPTPRR